MKGYLGGKQKLNILSACAVILAFLCVAILMLMPKNSSFERVYADSGAITVADFNGNEDLYYFLLAQNGGAELDPNSFLNLRELVIDGRSYPESGIKSLSQLELFNFSLLKTLEITNCPLLASTSLSGPAKFPALEEVYLSNLPTVTNVSFSGFSLKSFTARSLTNTVNIDFYFPVLSALEYLELYDIVALRSNTPLAFNNTPLKEIFIDRIPATALTVNLINCAQLKKVNISRIYSTINEINIINNPVLSHLSLTSCDSLLNLNIASLSSLDVLSVANLRNILSLNISDTPALRNLSVNNLANLISLSLTNLPMLFELSLLEVPKLDELNLNGCSTLEFTLPSLPILRSLNLDGCLRLSEDFVSGLTNQTPNLETLNISGLNFTILSLVNLSNLSALTFSEETEIHNLQLINIPKLNPTALLGFNLNAIELNNAGTAADGLAQINMTGASVKSLSLANLSITAINLSGCEALTGLKLSNLPLLSSLNTSGASKLERIEGTDISGLNALDLTGCSALDNGIEYLFSQLPYLNSITLTANEKITSFNLSNKPNLNYVDLTGVNNLESLIIRNSQSPAVTLTLPDEFNALRELRIYGLQNVTLQTTELTVINGVLATVDLRGLHLTYIDMSNNQISEACFRDIYKLSVLRLANNKLTDLAGFLNNLPGLFLTEVVLNNNLFDFSKSSTVSAFNKYPYNSAVFLGVQGFAPMHVNSGTQLLISTPQSFKYNITYQVHKNENVIKSMENLANVSGSAFGKLLEIPANTPTYISNGTYRIDFFENGQAITQGSEFYYLFHSLIFAVEQPMGPIEWSWIIYGIFVLAIMMFASYFILKPDKEKVKLTGIVNEETKTGKAEKERRAKEIIIAYYIKQGKIKIDRDT